MTATAETAFGFEIDLDAERSQRSARREAMADHLPLRFGGEIVAQIPTEMPLDVLAPLRRLDEEITLVIRTMMDVMRAEAEAQQRWDAASLIMDILATTPNLPSTLVSVIEDMAKRLLGEEGYTAFMSKRPTLPDMVALGSRLLSFYGMSLGESQPSSPSSGEEETSAGEISNPTSPTTTPDSTPAESGAAPASPASSEPDGS